MPMKMTLREEIAAPPERVFEVISDMDQAKHWMPNFVGIEHLTPGVRGVGAQFKETRKMYGREATEVFEVTKYEPPRELELFVDGRKGSTGRGEFRFRYSLEPQAGKTILTVDTEIKMGGGLMELIGKLFMGPMKKAIVKDHQALKRYIETGKPNA